MLSKFPVYATLPCSDLQQAKSFYLDKLGLKKAAGSAEDGFLMFKAGNDTMLHIFESDSKKSEDTAATFEVDNLTQAMADLGKKGVRFEEYDLPEIKTIKGVATMGEEKAAWFKDPGGNILCLHEAKK